MILYNLDDILISLQLCERKLEKYQIFFSSSVISSDCQHCVLNSLSNRTLSGDPRLAASTIIIIIIIIMTPGWLRARIGSSLNASTSGRSDERAREMEARAGREATPRWT